MKLSYNWLNDFVDLSGENPEEIADKLTMGAFEVEEVAPTRALLEDNVVLGEIKEIDKHPNADKLQVTQTEVANGEVFQIVCGAKNIAVGQKVPVALVGASVTNRHDGSELKIKKSKIRGTESCGMLCSADELGFDEAEVKSIKEKQGDGIYILDGKSNDAKLGSPIREVLQLENDFVLEVGARSNRGDALSVQGQAREIAALTGKKLKSPEIIDIKKHKNIEYDKKISAIEPKIADEKDCVLFYTVAIEGIEIKESPQWLKDRINAMGTKAINNVVDISNYVLLEMGQPMHFYDREKINGGYLEVRRAKAKEKITTLEEKTHELTKVNMVIADSKGPSSLAGVMGGMDSSINDNTKNIVIEVAVFNPATVRKSSRAAGVESESKRRFERGVDRANSKNALLRAIDLLSQIASPENGKIKVGEILMAGSEKVKDQKIKLRKEEVKRHLGIDIPEKTIIELLEKLEIKNTKGLEFSIPSFRQLDITREIDLIEEIGRLYGFDQIPSAAPETLVTSKREANQARETKKKIREVFTASGYSEAQLSSLIGDSVGKLDQVASLNLGISEDYSSIDMDNPLSREHRVLRKSMMPALIQAASRNYAYDKSEDIKLFEIGKIYYFKGDEKKPELKDIVEVPKIGAILVRNENDWTQAKPKTLAENFFELKSNVENLFPRAKFIPLKNSNNMFHPGIAAKIEQDRKEVGLIAKLHPSISKEWDLPDESYILELSHPQLKEAKFKAIASTPIVERDITVDSDNAVLAQKIQEIVEKNSSQDFKNIKLISLYRRANAEAGQAEKSTSFRLKWQSSTETLSGEAIDAEIVKLKGLLEKELGVRFRE